MTPVLLGMLLAIPLTVLTSRPSAGDKARKARLFLTPEETQPSNDILVLRASLKEAEKSQTGRPIKAGGEQAIVDPYVNALHLSLLQVAQSDRMTARAIETMLKDQSSIVRIRE